MQIEPIQLSSEQQKLRGAAKAQLYVNCYKAIIKQMKEKDVRFPIDLNNTNELGINVTEFARWCGFKHRGTLYQNKIINGQLSNDVKSIGVAGDPYKKSITSKKQDDLIAIQSKNLNEQGDLLASLNSQIELLSKSIADKNARIRELETLLAQSNNKYNEQMKTHQEQVKNSILSGGRTFDRA